MLEEQPTCCHGRSAGDVEAARHEAYPGQSERRLSLRLLSYWRHLAAGRDFAALADIDPAAIPEIWPHCFLLALDDKADDVRFRYVGVEIARMSNVPTGVARREELDGEALLAKASSYLRQVVIRRCPITIGGEFADGDGRQYCYRSIMLPLSEDQAVISAVLGAANCKQLP